MTAPLEPPELPALVDEELVELLVEEVVEEAPVVPALVLLDDTP